MSPTGSSSPRSCPTTAPSSHPAITAMSIPSRPCCSNSASSTVTQGHTGRRPTAKSSVSGVPSTMTLSRAPLSTTSITSPMNSSNTSSTTTASDPTKPSEAYLQRNLPPPKPDLIDQRISELAQLRANGSRECAPDDRLREAIQLCCSNGLLRRNDGCDN